MFDGAHIREVGALCEHPKAANGNPESSLFLSASLDGQVKIWSLDVSFTVSLMLRFVEVSNGILI